MRLTTTAGVALAIAVGWFGQPAVAGLSHSDAGVRIVTVDELDELAPGTTIGPGSVLVMRYDERPLSDGRACTAAFLFAEGANRYLGTGGQCFFRTNDPGPGGCATHGPPPLCSAEGTTVYACVERCEQFSLHWSAVPDAVVGGDALLVELGPVAFARQDWFISGQGSRDFGVVKIPQTLEPWLRASVPLIGGPTGEATGALGSILCAYDTDDLSQDVPATSRRVGVLQGQTETRFYWQTPGRAVNFHRVGAPVLLCDVVNGEMRATQAIGIATHHWGVTGSPQASSGVTINGAIALARDAGLQLSLVTATLR